MAGFRVSVVVSILDSLMYNEYKIVCRPNNQVTLTKQRITKKREPIYLSPETHKLSHDTINRLIVRRATLDGRDTYYDKVSRSVRVVPPVPSLDLTERFQQVDMPLRQSKPRNLRGYGDRPNVTYFTHRSGQKVRECGAVIDMLCNGDPSKCRVITLTLPASGHEAYDALSRYSGYATNRLFQVIRRNDSHAELYWFYVWEYQSRGALHLHLCLFHEDGKVSKGIGDEIVSKWRDVLRDISRKSGVNLLFSKGFNRDVALCDMQSINQQMYFGCGAYFSKYASKTASANPCMGEPESVKRSALCKKYPVSRFWGSSQNIKRMVRENSLSFKKEDLQTEDIEEMEYETVQILSLLRTVQIESFSFKKEIEVNGGKLTICEGESTVVYLTPESYQKFLSYMNGRHGKENSSALLGRGKRSILGLRHSEHDLFGVFF